VVFIVAFVSIDAVNGHQREFSLTDQTLMFTFVEHEIVPSRLLVTCAVISPGAIILLWTLFIPPSGSYHRKRWRSRDMTWIEKLWDANLSLLGLGLAIASTITITNTFKNLVGRPRPGTFLCECYGADHRLSRSLSALTGGYESQYFYIIQLFCVH